MATREDSPTVAFFGATGGSTLAGLVKSLQAGIRCSVLVRNSDKLKNLLQPHGLNLSQKGLSVTNGDIRDSEAVKKTLTFNGAEACATLIVSGVGSYPKFQASLKQPVGLGDATICASAAKTVLQALRELKPQRKPLVAVLSTTGLDKKRDVPLAFVPMYRWFLSMPHADKEAMERLFDQEEAAPDSSIAGVVTLKPSLLVDGSAKGPAAVRAGWDQTKARPDSKAPGPAIGYTITREDVGHWIFDNLVAKPDADRLQWAGRKVSLTN